MKKLLRTITAPILLLIVCLMTAVILCRIQSGLHTADYFRGFTELKLSFIMGLLFIIIQLAAMRWCAWLLNIMLTVTSIFLFGMMCTVALGPAISLTPELHQLADAVGLPNPLKANPALYWLIPTVWFLCLLGATRQVQAFCFALVCYALWLVITPVLNKGVAAWAAQEEPFMPNVLDVLSGAPWMPAAMLGCFLMLFIFFAELLNTLLPEQKKA